MMIDFCNVNAGAIPSIEEFFDLLIDKVQMPDDFNEMNNQGGAAFKPFCEFVNYTLGRLNGCHLSVETYGATLKKINAHMESKCESDGMKWFVFFTYDPFKAMLGGLTGRATEIMLHSFEEADNDLEA